jgi:cell division transport system permease protein
MFRNLSRTVSFKRPDLSFGRDDANRFLPWIIGFLAFVTTLILAGWLSLSAMINQAQDKQSLAFTVTLPAGSDNPTIAAQKIVSIVKNSKGVINVEILSNADMKNLVRPWLGGSDSIDLLPMPVIVEGSQLKAGAVDFTAIKRELKTTIPSAELVTQSGWMAQYASSISTLRILSLLVACLFFVMMGCIVVFVAKTSVRLHNRAVEILHSVGALDGYIAAQFQGNVGILTFKGAAVGTLLGAVLYTFLSWSGGQLNSPLLPRLDMGFAHAILYIALPLCVMLIAIAATRISVLGQLARRP